MLDRRAFVDSARAAPPAAATVEDLDAQPTVSFCDQPRGGTIASGWWALEARITGRPTPPCPRAEDIEAIVG